MHLGRLDATWIENGRQIMVDQIRASKAEMNPRGRVIESCYGAACSYARSGELEAALEALEECFRAGDRDAERWQLDPDLDSLRDDSRFRKLLAGMEERASRLAGLG